MPIQMKEDFYLSGFLWAYCTRLKVIRKRRVGRGEKLAQIGVVRFVGGDRQLPRVGVFAKIFPFFAFCLSYKLSFQKQCF